jgi:hypothetical protein
MYSVPQTTEPAEPDGVIVTGTTMPARKRLDQSWTPAGRSSRRPPGG